MNVEDMETPVDEGGEIAETSLRDELRAAMEAATAESEAPPEAAPPAGAEIEETPPAAGVERDEHGRFKAKAATEPAPESGAEAVAVPETAADPSAPAEAPSSWRADAKAAWEAVPPVAKAEIAKREREIVELTGKFNNERRFGRDFAEIIQPHYETIKGFGITPQFAVKVLLDNDRTMRFGKPEEKLSLARKMILDYGLDPAELAQPDPNVPSDPHMRAMQAEIARLRNQVAPPALPQNAPLPQPAANDTVMSQIEAFRSDPAHPHFDQVIDEMSSLIASGIAASLDDAYERAVWGNPTLRSTLMAQPTPAADPGQRQSQPAADKVAAARLAGASVARSPGPSGAPAPTSMREELRENLRRSGWPG